ncbi:MAG TPA: class II glutamine amidotransferase [Xanthobacteraceae bacterium]|jgi:glutamine amidotransferase|nr:class II glutamine amidotransferase [Xanthobacteraceae bacterium]
MCRWIAYRGETIPLEHYVTEPAHSLISQSIHALESTASVNGDGFGLGWYSHHPEPGLYREIRPAWSDDNLRYLCRHLQSRLFFAHVRAATGTPITRPNCHPFASGQWMFMHNGFIGSWNRMRRPIEAMIPDAFYPARIGTTDSEAIFLAMMGAGMENPVAAAENVLGRITDLANETDPGDHFRFTAALTNGKDLYAFRYAVNDKANTLYYRESDRGIVIVSEPLDKDKDWIVVPEGSVLIATAGRRARIVPLFHRQQEAAE